MAFMDKLKKNKKAGDEPEFKPMTTGHNQKPPMQGGANPSFNLNPNQQANPERHQQRGI